MSYIYIYMIILVILMENKNDKDSEEGMFVKVSRKSKLNLINPDDDNNNNNNQNDEKTDTKDIIKKRESTFLWACQKNDLESVKKIFSEGIDIDCCQDNLSAKCPIHIAALNRNFELMKFLLENGAYPDARDWNYGSNKIGGRTALHFICGGAWSDDYDTDDYDTDEDEDVYTDDYVDLTCELIELLVEHGANINAIDEGKNTPLKYSLSVGNPIIIKKLLDLGADPFIKRFGFSMIHYVCTNFINPKILYLLIDYGVDVSDVLLNKCDYNDNSKEIIKKYLQEKNNCI